MPAPVRPCFRALARERSLPSGVLGPVDFRALARLASIFFWLAAMCGATSRAVLTGTDDPICVGREDHALFSPGDPSA